MANWNRKKKKTTNTKNLNHDFMQLWEKGYLRLLKINSLM